jgi:Mg-chelatase subunit ChlD
MLVLGLIAIVVMFKSCDRDPGQQQARQQERAAAEAQQVDQELAPQKAVEPREGLAAAIAIDVSGSMDEDVLGENKRKEAKIVIARRAALDLVEQFATYARAHPDQPVLLGVYEFSRRRGEPDCRVVIPMGPPDRQQAAVAVSRLDADGGTPIGQAMITAKRALDDTGLTRRHLLVVTDGENTDGSDPALVARVLERQKDDIRAPLYFVAFDVDANVFDGVKKAGGLLLSAKSSTELAGTIDELLSDRILVEAPRMELETPRPAVEPPKPPR